MGVFYIYVFFKFDNNQISHQDFEKVKGTTFF